MKELWIRVLLSALVAFLLARTPLVLTANATEVISRGQARKIDSVIEFSGYTGVSVDDWLAHLLCFGLPQPGRRGLTCARVAI